MEQLAINSMTFGVVISIVGFEIGQLLKSKFKFAIFNPLLVSIVFVILFLLLFNIEYETYNNSAKYLSYLLTPATVCLSIPLYQRLQLLKDNWVAIIFGILAGAIASLISILIFAKIFNFSHELYVTLLPKSVTTAIGMGISDEFGGITTITVLVILVTGVFGNIFAESICKLFKITNPVARGIAIGTSSHAMGTTKAMELGEIEGAMSSLSIVIAGIFTLIGVNLFVSLA